MAGQKTHDEQIRIIEKRENTSNAGSDFDADDELGRSKSERKAQRGGAKLRSEDVELSDKDDRQMVRGENQESEHRKRRADD